MKIGLITDTHKKLGRAQRVVDILTHREKVDFIIHAGDVVRVEILDMLEASKIKYVAVYGNNDFHLRDYSHLYPLVEEGYRFELNKKTFSLTHYPPTWIYNPYIKVEIDTDIVVFGHTHICHDEQREGALVLNPGEVCARDSECSTFMVLEILDKGYKLKTYSREIGQDQWNVVNKEYKL